MTREQRRNVRRDIKRRAIHAPRPDNLGALPFADYADPDPNRLPLDDAPQWGMYSWKHNPTPAEQIAAGCGDGHDPADATGVCTRCGYDCEDYFRDDCEACGADDGEPCRPSCIGLAAHYDRIGGAS